MNQNSQYQHPARSVSQIKNTATHASATPAPKPATKFLAGVNFPFWSRSDSLITELRPNRIPAFGMLPSSVGVKPRYRERKPVVRTVYDSPEIMPLYGKWTPGTLDCNWSCVCEHDTIRGSMDSTIHRKNEATKFGMNLLSFSQRVPKPTLINSMGQTHVASTPPAMQPAVIAVNGFLDFGGILKVENRVPSR